MRMQEIIHRHLRKNESLHDYFLPPASRITTDVQRNWQPMTEQCKFSQNCFCFHVRGSLDKNDNPKGAEECEVITKMQSGDRHKETKIGKCTNKKQLACNETCIVGHGEPCLFSNMAPAKVLAVIATARAAGVTHIIEEGRLGGITAFMYSMHGFQVTSIEYLPLDEVTTALRLRAPGCREASNQPLASRMPAPSKSSLQQSDQSILRVVLEQSDLALHHE